MSGFLGDLGTGLGNFFDWASQPTAAQQAMLAGRWNDPSLAEADRTSALLQGAIQGARASQQGLGFGASLAATQLPLAQAGLSEGQARAQIGEALARAGLYQAQTGAIPFDTALKQL